MSRPALDIDRTVPVLMVKIGHYPLHHGAVGAIRSLGRLGVPVYAITEDRYTPAALSRYLVERFCWPTTGREPLDDLVAGLNDVASRIGRPAIAIATDDEAAVLLAERGDELDRLILPAIAPLLPRALASKQGLHELCKRHAVPTPQSFVPESRDEALAYADGGEFPIVAKNAHPWTRLQTPAVQSSTIFNTPDELRAAARDWADPPNVLFQQLIPKEQAEDWIFHMYCDERGDCLAAFTGVKLRSWPPRGGVTALARITGNEELAELAASFCREIGFQGIGDLDWRFDRRDGRYKLLDFNPRVGAQFRLFETDDGLDVVRALHLDLTGRPVPRGRQIEGRRFYVENLYAAAMIVPRERAAELPCLERKLAKPELGWLAVDDPLPVLAMAIRFSGRVLRWLWRSRRPRRVRERPRITDAWPQSSPRPAEPRSSSRLRT